MSLRDLATHVGLSATAISKFERGEISPRQSTLLALAKALSVNVEFFFREVRVDTLNAAYRKHATLGTHAQQAIEASIIETVERHLIAEEYAVAKPEPDLGQVEVRSLYEAEGAADALRKPWQLGIDPVDDLCGQLENSGVKIIALDEDVNATRLLGGRHCSSFTGKTPGAGAASRIAGKASGTRILTPAD